MPHLAFNLNDGNEFVFDLLEERLSIGRDTNNDIVIDNSFISSFHAEFHRQVGGAYELVDLKASNGTFVNGQRVDRAILKGGDRLRFGQLEARFREVAPKGSAPPTLVSKNPMPTKDQPPRTDGRMGDTETIPARDLDLSPPAPIRPPPPPVVQAPTTAEAKELGEEIARLKRECDLLKAEIEKAARRRDELQALEERLEARRKESAEAETKLEALKQEVSSAQAEAAKWTEKRRDAANLENKVEASRTELTKVEADLATAKASLQLLHADAEKVRAERLEANREVTEVQSASARAIIEAEERRQAVEKAIETKSEELKKLEARVAEMSAQSSALATKLEGFVDSGTKIESASEAVKAVEAHKAELAAAIASLTQDRDRLTRDVFEATEKGRAQHGLTLALTQRREAAEREVQVLEDQKTAVAADLEQARAAL
ncbi:MAG TPA: FHA domain-containing protein, partial [Prosthecobacter sp.]|nr:FHA domain-containing protein [Prosthecobacter sp.]